MITVRKEEQNYEFEIWAERPCIYLDHWALRRLSENSTLGNRFLVAFEQRGTVMFSLMNVAEISRDASQQRAQQIRHFLAQLGVHWFPMTIDPLRIIDADQTGTTPDGLPPCASAAFLTDPHFASCLVAGPLSLTHVVDLTFGPGGEDLRQVTDQMTAELRQNIQDWRDEYAMDPNVLDERYPLLQFDARRPVRGIYYGLARYTITDTFTLNDNHARDLFHAVASVHCADMVTLDPHWAGQVQKLKLPPDFVQVYSQRDLDRFLADLEAAPATRCGMGSDAAWGLA